MCLAIATYIRELSLLKISSPLPNGQGAGNHDKNPSTAQFLWTVSPWLINELGLMGAGAVFWFPGRRGPRAAFLPLPGLPWNWRGGVGEQDQTPCLQALKPHAASSDLPRFPQTRNSLLV